MTKKPLKSSKKQSSSYRKKALKKPGNMLFFLSVAAALGYGAAYYARPHIVSSVKPAAQQAHTQITEPRVQELKITENDSPVRKRLLQTTPAKTKISLPKISQQIVAPQETASEKTESVQAGEPPWMKYAAPAQVPKGFNKIVIIIDDVGMNYSAAKELIAMKAPLTLAFLPYANHVRALAKDAREKGHEILIHMPMEPMNPDLDTGDIVLTTEESDEDFNRNLREAFASMDGYVGMNNHMGSRLTQDKPAMQRLMKALKEKGLLFVDSRTIAATVADKTAAQYGVPHISRDVFLDNTPTVAEVNKSLAHVERIAQKYGVAVAIGHPKNHTIEAIKAWLPTLKDKKLVIVPVSNVVKSSATQTQQSKTAQN